MQDKKHMYQAIGLGIQNFSYSRFLSVTIFFQATAMLEEKNIFISFQQIVLKP